MKHNNKLYALLLGSVCIVPQNIYGNLLDYLNETSKESAHTAISNKVALQREAMTTAATEAFNALGEYKDKPQTEKDKFIALFTAIVLQTQESSTSIKLKNDTSSPKLEDELSTEISNIVTNVLMAPTAYNNWDDFISPTKSNDHLLYRTLEKPLTQTAHLTLPPLARDTKKRDDHSC